MSDTPPHRLPEGFIWGTGASSTQTEGAAPRSDWARWEALGRVPASGEGNGFGARFREDFALLAEAGLTHHRLSLEWARLEPYEGRHDPAAAEHYGEVLRAARDAGLSTWACLHHFTLPGWFADDLGGFRDVRARTYHWPKHVEWVGETFGDLIDGWMPVNEPVAYAFGGWLTGAFPPGVADPFVFLEALRDVHLAAAEAARRLHGNGAPVATVMNLSPVTSRPSDPGDAGAVTRARDWTRLIDDVIWGWTRLVRDGVLAVPGLPDVHLAWAQEVWDLIGFSYYNAHTVDEHGAMGPYPADGRVGPLDYVPWPEGLRVVIDRLSEELPGRPLLVAEWGVGTRPGHELEEQAELVEAGLRHVEAAVADGADVRGLFHWTGVDNYEWNHGFDVAFGLFTRGREPKPAAEVARRWARPR